MLGMEMMMKALGIDGAQVQEMGKQVVAFIQNVDERLTRIEKKIDAMQEKKAYGESESNSVGEPRYLIGGSGEVGYRDTDGQAE